MYYVLNVLTTLCAIDSSSFDGYILQDMGRGELGEGTEKNTASSIILPFPH